MALDDYPDAFVSALQDMFKDVESARPEHIAKLHRLWTAAQEDERHAVFKFMRSSLERSEDREGIVQLSWVIGNGTYRRTPDLSVRPWWLEEDEDEDWKAFVADRLEVRRRGTNTWMVYLRETGEHVARITSDETGNYEVWHAPEVSAQMVEVRWHQTWTAATRDVVARQVMRQKGARSPQGASGAV